MDLITIELNEVSELEPLVIEKIDKLEDGLEVLDNQLSIGDHGRPDIFALDIDKVLVLIELKSVEASPYAISQSIRYYEWLTQNLALVARTFPKIDTTSNIRIFIVAPEFENESINIARYLDLKLEFIKYIALQNAETKEIDLIFEPIELEPVEESSATFLSVDDIVNYFSDKTISEEFKKCLEFLKKHNVKIEPYKGGRDNWLECTYKNEDIAFFAIRRNFFLCQTYDEEIDDYIWPPHKLFSYDDWILECWNEIEKEIKLLDEPDDD